MKQNQGTRISILATAICCACVGLAPTAHAQDVAPAAQVTISDDVTGCQVKPVDVDAEPGEQVLFTNVSGSEATVTIMGVFSQRHVTIAFRVDPSGGTRTMTVSKRARRGPVTYEVSCQPVDAQRPRIIINESAPGGVD